MASGVRWLIQNYLQTWLDGTVVITFDTDKAVHAWLCHSETPPNMHLQSLDRRGLAMMKDPYFCFLKQECFQQDEPGDTLHHTFTWPGWYHCLTQWFFFKATAGGSPTPTQWGIFSKHYSAAGVVTLLPRANGTYVWIQNPPDKSVHWQMCQNQDTTWFPPDPRWMYGKFEGNYVWMRIYNGPLGDADRFLYDPLPPQVQDIVNVRIVQRVGKVYVYGRCATILLTRLNVYWGTITPIGGPGLVEYVTDYPVNPFTLEKWTPAEVNTLEAGVWLEHSGTFGMAICDQTRVEVSWRPVIE